MQKTAYYRPKGGLLHSKRPPFTKQPETTPPDGLQPCDGRHETTSITIKHQHIMKKIFTSLLLFMAAAITANAEMKTVWEGSHEIGNWNWDTRLELTADVFSTLADGDKMVVTMSPNVEAAGAETWYQYDITANDYVGGRDPQRTPIASGDISEAGDVTINLTNEQASLLKKHGMVINGHFVTITKIAVGTEESSSEEGTTVELWSGSVATGNWENYVNLSYGSKPAALGTAKVGDVITVTFDATGEGAHVQIADPDGWVAFDTESSVDVASPGAGQTFAYTINDVAVLEKIQLNGILVRGHDFTATKVELTTYDGNYDAVLITIGEAGVATYSNSSKALDFTAADIKAYCATAVEVGKVTLSPVAAVPAYTGIMVKGEPGTYEVRTGEAEAPAANYLRAVGDWEQAIKPYAEGNCLYIFTETSEPTFSLVAAGTTVPARKAYLETTTDITPVDGVIELVFTDEIESGIEAVTTEKQGDDAWYNLQGMRVERPAHGIYIHNGKKVLVK